MRQGPLQDRSEIWSLGAIGRPQPDPVQLEVGKRFRVSCNALLDYHREHTVETSGECRKKERVAGRGCHIT
jgi:hypothetical protein